MASVQIQVSSTEAGLRMNTGPSATLAIAVVLFELTQCQIYEHALFWEEGGFLLLN